MLLRGCHPGRGELLQEGCQVLLRALLVLAHFARGELVNMCSRRHTVSMLRSYHVEYTGSHQNSEVKLRWAGLVLC